MTAIFWYQYMKIVGTSSVADWGPSHRAEKHSPNEGCFKQFRFLYLTVVETLF